MSRRNCAPLVGLEALPNPHRRPEPFRSLELCPGRLPSAICTSPSKATSGRGTITGASGRSWGAGSGSQKAIGMAW